MKPTINIGMLGLGRMGQIHFRHLTQHTAGALVVAIADPLSEETTFRQKWKVARYYTDPYALLETADIDAVIISTPTDTHAGLVEKAINSKKHIFCEKPLDLSLDVTRRLLKQAAAAGIQLMLGFNRRFDPDVLEARQCIENGRIGNVQIIKITNRDPAIPPIAFIRSSGGMFMDFSIHDFDMAGYLMQKKVTEVFAKGLVFMDAAVGEAGDIDTALVTLTFEDGTYAVIDNSRKAVYGYDQRIEIFGDRGMMMVNNNPRHHTVLYDESGEHRALPLSSFVQRYERSYLNEITAFIEAIRHHTPIPQTAAEIETATEIAYAAQQSLREQRPVTMGK